jgi:putative ABC transport system substrate-binding protein
LNQTYLIAALGLHTLLYKSICRQEKVVAPVGREQGGAPFLFPDAFTATHRKTIAELAAQYRVPAIYCFSDFPADGGLLSYGVPVEVHRWAASYVDRILKGEKPSDLPVQQPTKFELVINVKTAKALGLVVPPSLLARADQLLE